MGSMGEPLTLAGDHDTHTKPWTGASDRGYRVRWSRAMCGGVALSAKTSCDDSASGAGPFAISVYTL